MVGNEYEREFPQFSFQAVNDLEPMGAPRTSGAALQKP